MTRSLPAILALTLVLPFTLAGCESKPPEGPVNLAPTCGADRLQGLIGQDIGVITEIDLPEELRIIHPGDSITEDYRPSRLNIRVDENGIIDRVWCV